MLLAMSRPRTRPRREATRERLFHAAAVVFTRDGIAGASIEDICAEAGLTRGALYSNFENKDGLVMAMIGEHVEQNQREMERLIALSESPTQYLELIESPERRRNGPFAEFPVLYMEFVLYAIRNPSYRETIAGYHARQREVAAQIVQRSAELNDVDVPMPVADVAALIHALDMGYLLQELIEPGSYAPGTFSRNLLTLQALWFSSQRSPNSESGSETTQP